MPELTHYSLKCDLCGIESPLFDGDNIPEGWITFWQTNPHKEETKRCLCPTCTHDVAVGVKLATDAK